MTQKLMKKRVGVLFLVILLVSLLAVSFATSYSSTLRIGGNSTLEGEWRSYDAGTMKISIRFDSLDVPTSSNNMTVALDKKNIIGYTQVGSFTSSYLKNNIVTSNYGYQSKDTYRFYFDTYGFPTSGGNAGYVMMGNF